MHVTAISEKGCDFKRGEEGYRRISKEEREGEDHAITF